MCSMCSNVQLAPGYEPHFPSLLVTHMSHMSIELLSFPKKGLNTTDQSLLEHFKQGSMEMEMLKAGDQFASCFYQSAQTCLSFLCSGVAGFVLTPAEAILDPGSWGEEKFRRKPNFAASAPGAAAIWYHACGYEEVAKCSPAILPCLRNERNLLSKPREIQFSNQEKYVYQTVKAEQKGPENYDCYLLWELWVNTLTFL